MNMLNKILSSKLLALSLGVNPNVAQGSIFGIGIEPR